MPKRKTARKGRPKPIWQSKTEPEIPLPKDTSPRRPTRRVTYGDALIRKIPTRKYLTPPQLEFLIRIASRRAISVEQLSILFGMPEQRQIDLIKTAMENRNPAGVLINLPGKKPRGLRTVRSAEKFAAQRAKMEKRTRGTRRNGGKK